jgi:hypothetical protein
MNLAEAPNRPIVLRLFFLPRLWSVEACQDR